MKLRKYIHAKCLGALCLGLALIVAPLTAGSQPSETNAPGQFFAVDLSKFVTTVFSNAPQGNPWSYVPRGRQLFQGIPFQIDGKFEVTGMDGLKGGSDYIPTRVSGIPIGRKAENLLLLHATGYTEKDGT